MVGYGVAAFAVLQIAEPIMHGFHWPDAVLSYVVAALAVGFPVVVSLAWIFDVNAGRIERTGPAAGLGGARLVAILAGIGVLAASPGLVWYFFVRKQAQPAPAASAVTPPSIAVLAFADLSPSKDQEYFSDGIAEEILNALSRVKGLKVAGRTSSFSFKGKNQDLRGIGETLGVANLLEGSVRKQGNKVRITAQLIQASDGFHLWSKTFDGELTDVFELQERIARGITTHDRQARPSAGSRRPSGSTRSSRAGTRASPCCTPSVGASPRHLQKRGRSRRSSRRSSTRRWPSRGWPSV